MNAKSCCLILAAGLMTTAVPRLAQSQSNGVQNQTGMQDQSPGQNNSAARPWRNQSSSASGTWSSQTAMGGTSVASRMVPARAVFTGTVQSKDAQPGTPVNVKLTSGVKLDDGTHLAKGTLLSGQVVADNSQQGNARIALQFDQAKLESGQSIPIKATIVGIYNTPDQMGPADYAGADTNSVPPSWNSSTLQIDQISALPGIDLHSKIASPNSGVFVSTKKDNIKLSPKYSLTIAVADHPGSNSSVSSNTGFPNSQNSYAPGQYEKAETSGSQPQNTYYSQNTAWHAGVASQTQRAYPPPNSGQTSGTAQTQSGVNPSNGQNLPSQSPGTMSGTYSESQGAAHGQNAPANTTTGTTHTQSSYAPGMPTAGAQNSGTVQSQGSYGQGTTTTGTARTGAGTSATGAQPAGTLNSGTTSMGTSGTSTGSSGTSTGTSGTSSTTGSTGTGPR